MRLDAYLFENKKYPSRNKASEAVLRGEVLYNGKTCKPSREVVDESLISYVLTETVFVSNGGYKLEKAFNDFNLNVNGLTFVDVGASNGGFTECLLNHGAKKVYAVDIGESQLDKKLSCDDRVTVLDNLNARNLTVQHLNGLVDGAVTDVSFISLTYILNAVYNVLTQNGMAIMLIKPQFECGKEYLGKSGIVKDVNARLNACLKIYDSGVNLGFKVNGFTVAPIKEKKNIEYVILFKKDGETTVTKQYLKDLVNNQR